MSGIPKLSQFGKNQEDHSCLIQLKGRSFQGLYWWELYIRDLEKNVFRPIEKASGMNKEKQQSKADKLRLVSLCHYTYGLSSTSDNAWLYKNFPVHHYYNGRNIITASFFTCNISVYLYNSSSLYCSENGNA